jgi:long-chain-fatty-acid---luciferin-component ligase
MLPVMAEQVLRQFDAPSVATRPTPTRLPTTYVGAQAPVETVLYGEDDPYRWNPSRTRLFQSRIFSESFAFHYANCQSYQRYCVVEGVSPAALTMPEDIVRIPLIPASMFKEQIIQSVGADAIAKVCQSSGTQGSISRVPRDGTSLERFVGSIRLSAEMLLDLRVRAHMFNLGPDTDAAGDIWLPYVMSLISLLRPATHYVVDGVLELRRLVDDLVALDEEVQPIIVGPPIFVVYLLRFLEDEGIVLDLGVHRGLLVTGGGWKTHTDEQVDSAAFRAWCTHQLGLDDFAVRDAYNLVEVNTVILECEAARKHVPPWLVVAALDAEAQEPVPPGEMGVLAYWDALPTSYPGFILTDDFGAVDSSGCACGRAGPTMRFLRRVTASDDRGCARAMDRDTEHPGRSGHDSVQ